MHIFILFGVWSFSGKSLRWRSTGAPTFCLRSSLQLLKGSFLEKYARASLVFVLSSLISGVLGPSFLGIIFTPTFLQFSPVDQPVYFSSGMRSSSSSTSAWLTVSVLSGRFPIWFATERCWYLKRSGKDWPTRCRPREWNRTQRWERHGFLSGKLFSGPFLMFTK